MSGSHKLRKTKDAIKLYCCTGWPGAGSGSWSPRRAGPAATPGSSAGGVAAASCAQGVRSSSAGLGLQHWWPCVCKCGLHTQDARRLLWVHSAWRARTAYEIERTSHGAEAVSWLSS